MTSTTAFAQFATGMLTGPAVSSLTTSLTLCGPHTQLPGSRLEGLSPLLPSRILLPGHQETMGKIPGVFPRPPSQLGIAKGTTSSWGLPLDP